MQSICDRRVRLWPKQLSHGQCRDLIAAEMLAALSVVMAESVSRQVASPEVQL